MKVWIMGAAALGLAVTAGAIAQDIDPSMKPLPGQYESQLKLLSMDVPGMPANMTDMMRGAMEKTTKICLTEEEVEQGFRDALKKSQDGECSYKRFEASGGTIDAEMVCNTDNGPLTMLMNGTGSPTESDVTMDISGDLEGLGQMNMKMRVMQKRIGDC